MNILKTAAATAMVGLGTLSAQAFEPIISIGGAHTVIHPNGNTDELLATQEQTDGMLGILTLESPAAGDGPGPAIVHASRAEFWYVLAGTYEFHIGDKTVEGGPGTFIGVPAGQQHGFISKSKGRLLTIFMPGGYEHFFMDWDAQELERGPALGKLENSYGATRP